jgi:hypothetical protein
VDACWLQAGYPAHRVEEASFLLPPHHQTVAIITKE